MVCRECRGNTLRGTRCGRYASCRVGCKYYCWQHADDYVTKEGCPRRKRRSSRKRSSRASARDPGGDKQGILKPPRSKSKEKKTVRFKPKKSREEIFPIPSRRAAKATSGAGSRRSKKSKNKK